MVVVALLLTFAAGVVWWGPRVAAASVQVTAPRQALLVCQAIAAAAAGAVVLIAGMTVVSVQHLRPDVEHLLHACAVAVWNNALHPGVPATSALGALAALVVVHVLRTGLVSAARVRRIRQDQRRVLALVGEEEEHFTRVTSDHVFAYCLPGRGGRIVVSTAAEQQLDATQLDAVLAHERAHLRGRHHLVVHITQILARAIPLPSLRLLHQQARDLVELVADDRACRATSSEALLGALLRLSGRRHGPGLAANGGDCVARALRLLEPGGEQGLGARLAVALGALALLVTPWVIGGLPVLLAVTGHCDGTGPLLTGG